MSTSYISSLVRDVLQTLLFFMHAFLALAEETKLFTLVLHLVDASHGFIGCCHFWSGEHHAISDIWFRAIINILIDIISDNHLVILRWLRVYVKLLLKGDHPKFLVDFRKKMESWMQFLNLIPPIDQGFESREKLLFCQLLSFVLMTIPREFTSSSESLRKIDLGSVLHLGGRLKPLIPLSAKPYLGRFSEESFFHLPLSKFP